MPNFELSEKQVERILKDQISSAIDAAAKKILGSAAPGDELFPIMNNLKKECNRILKGELIYPLR